MPQGTAVWLALLFVANPVLVIGSTSDCPSAAHVVAEIASLLPAGMTARPTGGAEAEPTDHAELALEGGARWVRLRSHDERFNHERALPRSLTCAEAARAAAVLLAAWEFQGRTELPAGATAPNTPAAPAPQPPAAAVAPGPAPRSEPGAVAPREPAESQPREQSTIDQTTSPTTSPTSNSLRVAQPPPPAAPPPPGPRADNQASPPTAIEAGAAAGAGRAPGPRRNLGLGAGVAVARAVDRFVVGAAGEVVFGPASGLGLRLQVATTARDSITVGTGRANWTRSSVGVGASLTARRGAGGRTGLQAHADLLGAVFAISGENFAMNAAGTQLAIGAALGGRGVVGLGSSGDFWFDLTLTSWPGQHDVILRGATAGRSLPAAEVGAGVGVDFFVWP